MGDQRVEVKVDLSLPVPGVDFAHVKPAITLSGIDPEGDVPAQISRGLETASQMLVSISDHLTEVALPEILAAASGAPGYRERLAANEELTRRVRDRLNETIRKLGSLNARLEAVEADPTVVEVVLDDRALRAEYDEREALDRSLLEEALAAEDDGEGEG